MKVPDQARAGIGQRVKELRKSSGLTQVELASAISSLQSSIAQIERGGSFSDRLLRDVATALHVSEQWLRTGHGEKHISAMTDRDGIKCFPSEKTNVRIERVLTPWREVPVVSWATAGAAKDYEDLGNFLDEMVVTECKDKNAFAVIVDGDSMEPKISAGDRIVISPNSEAHSGDLVIARTRKDHRVFFKRFLLHGPHGNKVRLVSFNPDYPPIEFELSDFRFIYPVVNLVRTFRHTNGAG